MKIGITTFQWSDNYGAVLQAHALQSFLQARGHEVEIVDYRKGAGPSRVQRLTTFAPQWTVALLYPAILFAGFLLRGHGAARLAGLEMRYKSILFELFRRHHLNRTPTVISRTDELADNADGFDLYITGSDQVWNPQWLAQAEGLFDVYFLSFASWKAARISYAASIGHADASTMTDEWKELLATRMRDMDAISVREKSSVDLVEALSGRTDAVQVIDPTLLLCRTHYDHLAGPKKNRKSYVFSYMLHDMEADAQGVCDQLAETISLGLVRCDAKKTRFHRGYELPGPADWLRLIRDASFVVTNSFHGTVFCLIFHVPFVAVLIDGAIGSMNSRITDLLADVGLGLRVVSANDRVESAILNNKIDWIAVDNKIGFMRETSMQFLEKQGL